MATAKALSSLSGDRGSSAGGGREGVAGTEGWFKAFGYGARE